MDDYYRNRSKGQRIVFDPLARGLRKNRHDNNYGDIHEGHVTSLEKSSVTSYTVQKLCIAVLCVFIVVSVTSAAVTLAIILSADSSPNNEATTLTASMTTLTQQPTTTETSVDVTTTQETTTEGPPPSYNYTATTITYPFEDTFPDNLDGDEYLVYVSTEPNEDLLNTSVTWAMIQDKSPPYAFVALRCVDLFETGDCSGNTGTRKKRRTLSTVILQIGIDKCAKSDIDTLCNGALEPGTDYYLMLQLILDDGTSHNSKFSHKLSTSDSSPNNEATTLTASMTTLTQQPTTTETSVDVTTIQETTTEGPPPSYNYTATTITYPFEDTFTDNLDDDKYLVYVSTEPNEDLLNASVTWAMIQDKSPPYAFVALRCVDLFETGDCSGNTGTRKKRQALSTVILQIGIEKCAKSDIDTLCNGALEPGTDYYLMLQLILDDGTSQNSKFSHKLSTSVYGSWSEWGEWGDCDVSCGGGIQRRTRDCEGSEFCIGSASTSQRCNSLSCPVQVLHGSWLSWSSWTPCTVTCGGGAQVRSRECDRGTSDLDCVGNNSHQLECESWACPDCTKTCTSGHLSASCTHCECHGEFEGVVRSTTGIALANVKISISDAPYQVLNTTGPNGHYVLDNLCVSQTLLFHKDGYSSFTTEASWIPNIVNLEGEESLTMDLHPRSKKRLVGDDVLFCCAAIGNPLPSFYEWFKDGVQLAGESGSTLSLTSVTLDSAGAYRCRASTALQGIYSAEATLTVKENADDFCPESTESKFQQLPTGCLYNDETVIDVGECTPLRCRGESVNNDTCNDPERFCCAATQLETVRIPCDGFTFDVFRTKLCGCSKCTSPVVDIQGLVFSAEDEPMEGVDIYYNKSVVAQTASNGQFYFNVPEGTRRVAITAKPSNSSEYADGIGVLSLNEDADGVYYIHIYLVRVLILDPINSTQDHTLELGNGTNTIVEVDIEANSFFDEDGNLYEGSVSPQVSVVESTNLRALESAPGDFTTTDQNGEEQILKTYGMVSMAFKDPEGKSLQVQNEVQMNVPEGVLGQVDDKNTPGASNPLHSIKLYKMNGADGVWLEIDTLASPTSKRRRKRSGNYYGVTIAGISPTSEWYNFDAVASSTCISKVKVFGSQEYTEANQITGAQVFAFIKGNDDTYSFSTRLVNDNDASKGYCIVHRCDRPDNENGFKGFLVVKKDGKYLVPAVNNTGLGDLEQELEYQAFEDKVEVKYSLNTNINGPFYDWKDKWKYSPKCTNAPFGDKHFRFHLQKEDQCHQFQEFSFTDGLTDECKTKYYRSWYTAPEIRVDMFTTCYIRVQIAHYTNNVKVEAYSKVGTFGYINDDGEIIIEPENNYGYHEDCTVGGSVCVKIKPPGKIGCSNNQAYDRYDDHTSVSVTARYKSSNISLNVSDVNTALRDEHNVLREDSIFDFEMKSVGTIGGIFCRSGSKTQSNNDALTNCLESGDEGYSVKFGNSIECGAEIVLILDTSGSMASYSTTNRDWMLQIPDYFPIGDAHIRVSLILVYNNDYNTIWDLSSQYTASNEKLIEAIKSYPNDEAVSSQIGLADALMLADNNIQTHARDGAARVIIMFWDGDLNLSSTVSGFNDTSVLSVSPRVNANVQSIVADTDKDMFYITQDSSTEFVDRLAEIMQCT